jgi:hypothetical protein
MKGLRIGARFVVSTPVSVLSDIVLNSSNGLPPQHEYNRLLREGRARVAARIAVKTPRVEYGKQYKDGLVHFPKSNEWIFPDTSFTLSKRWRPDVSTKQRHRMRSLSPSSSTLRWISRGLIRPKAPSPNMLQWISQGLYQPMMHRTATRSRPPRPAPVVLRCCQHIENK